MNYVQRMRRVIGHAPLILVGANVLVLDGARRLLLQRRTDNGLWGLPGGSMEPGESLEETARRELREETGLEIGTLELFGLFSGEALHYKYPNGDEVYDVNVVYVATEPRGELRTDPEEGHELRYFPLDSLPATISPLDQPALDLFLGLNPAAGTVAGRTKRGGRKPRD